MRVMKYLCFSLFSLVLLLCYTESRQIKLNSLEGSFYRDSLTVEENATGWETVETVCRQYQVEFFVVKEETVSPYLTEVRIYADSSVRKQLTEMGYAEGVHKSLFSGDSNLIFMPASELYKRDGVQLLCYLGDREQIAEAVKTLHPEKPRYRTNPLKPEMTMLEGVILVLCFCAVLVLLYMTVLQIQFEKKEHLLQILSGASGASLLRRDVGWDMLTYVLLFVTVGYTWKSFAAFHLWSGRVFGVFLVFLLFNALVHYAGYKRWSYKEVFYGANISLNRIGDCYIIKSVAMMAVILLVAVNSIPILQSAGDFYLFQKVKAYQEYSFAEFPTYLPQGETDGESFGMAMMEKEQKKSRFFYDAYREGGAVLAHPIEVFDVKKGKTVGDVYAVNAYTEGIQKLVGSSVSMSDGRYLILIPENTESRMTKEQIRNSVSSAFPGFHEKQEYDILHYSRFNLLYFVNDSTETVFRSVQNPIMVYCGFEGGQVEENDYSAVNSLIPVKYQPGDADTIADRYERRAVWIQKTTDYCRASMTAGLRRALVAVAGVFVLLVLELEIMIVLAKFEYLIKARELAIKKILGYGILEQNLELFILNMVTTMIAFTIILILSLALHLASWYMVLLGTVVLSVLENILLYFYLMKADRKHTPAILKGGCL